MSLQGQKINRVSMRNNAYERIKNAIISGELKPEERLRDKELSEQLGISRTPVREAMLRLEDEEFIISKPNSYTMVAPIDVIEVKEIYSIVIALETLALEEAIKNPQLQDVEDLISINQDYKAAIEQGDPKRCLENDRNFHAQIVKMSGNNELEKLLTSVKEKILRVESYYFHNSVPKDESLQQHNVIIECIKNNELAQATNMLKENWMNSLTSILK
ncbi:GntR family transcriptional regulator [Salicibibacter halophilus]|uniref:GntR family transcriptional regulator n=1 Tax=Salicibibacter halophilus TaxID=2502791 RepID=A0A514LMC1_9BACI|nr:GntR family transcriptional regulator [Salicibibacter halophilus]QDI92685.1 GntR family transcriptional regulator [Salicibibacter halophilus]